MGNLRTITASTKLSKDTAGKLSSRMAASDWHSFLSAESGGHPDVFFVVHVYPTETKNSIHIIFDANILGNLISTTASMKLS